MATHGIFSGDAPKKFTESDIEKVIVTNTVNLSEDHKFDKLEVISVAGLFARAIECTHNGESISALFEF